MIGWDDKEYDDKLCADAAEDLLAFMQEQGCSLDHIKPWWIANLIKEHRENAKELYKYEDAKATQKALEDFKELFFRNKKLYPDVPNWHALAVCSLVYLNWSNWIRFMAWEAAEKERQGKIDEYAKASKRA